MFSNLFPHFFFSIGSVPFLFEFYIFFISLFYLFIRIFLAQKIENFNLTIIFDFFSSLKKYLGIFILFNFFALFNSIMFQNMTFFHGFLLNDFSGFFFKFFLQIFLYITITQFFNFVYRFYVYWSNLEVYPLLILGIFFFSSLVISTYNLLLTVFSIIGLSICLYVLLMGHFMFGKLSREAAIKYFLFSALSTGLLLNGIKDFYIISQTLNFNLLNDFLVEFLLTSITTFENVFIIKYAFLFLFSGFLFKLSAFPTFFWAPEVYEGTSFFSIFLIVIPLKFTIIVILLKILKFIFLIQLPAPILNIFLWKEFNFFLVIIICLSMIFGAVNACIEQKLKRFIAYSSITQIGYLLIGFLGYKTSLFNVQAILYFLSTYVFNVGILIILCCWFLYKFNIFINHEIFFENRIKFDFQYMTDFKYLFFFMRDLRLVFPFLYHFSISFWILFVLTIFSLAGIPPLFGFYGKFYILLYALHIENWNVFIAGIIISLISAFYYLRILALTFFIIEKDIKSFTIWFNDYFVENLKEKNFIFLYWSFLENKYLFFFGNYFRYNFFLMFLLCVISFFTFSFDSIFLRYMYLLAQHIIIL